MHLWHLSHLTFAQCPTLSAHYLDKFTRLAQQEGQEIFPALSREYCPNCKVLLVAPYTRSAQVLSTPPFPPPPTVQPKVPVKPQGRLFDLHAPVVLGAEGKVHPIKYVLEKCLVCGTRLLHVGGSKNELNFVPSSSYLPATTTAATAADVADVAKTRMMMVKSTEKRKSSREETTERKRKTPTENNLLDFLKKL